MNNNSNSNYLYTDYYSFNNESSKINIENRTDQNRKIKSNNFIFYRNFIKDAIKNQTKKTYSNSFDTLKRGNDITYLNNLNSEYDKHIMNLKEQLSYLKGDRIKTENEANIIKHRLLILKKKEQNYYIQFKNIKNRLKIIINNRKEANKRAKKIKNKNNGNKKYNNNNNNDKSYHKLKKNNSTNENSKIQQITGPMAYKNRNNYSFYSTPYLLQSLYKSNNNNNYNDNLVNEEEKGNNLREKMLNELKKDEEEKRKIEEEIAKIEQEELNLFNDFKSSVFM
jgi:hypothetical protein